MADDHVLLWEADDPYIWHQHPTIEAAKAAAELHWQKAVQAITQ